jgi:hypothetical protein
MLPISMRKRLFRQANHQGNRPESLPFALGLTILAGRTAQESAMKTFVSIQKGAYSQQDMKLYAISSPLDQGGCKRTP